MLWLIVGVVVGVGVVAAVQHGRREDVSVPWYSWLLGAVAVVFALLAIEVFAGSLVESETQAAWMGLAAFAVPGVILGALAWWLSARAGGDDTSDVSEAERAAA